MTHKQTCVRCRRPLHVGRCRIDLDLDSAFEALEHAHTRFRCLADEFEAVGDSTSWAMCSVDADRMLKALGRTE